MSGRRRFLRVLAATPLALNAACGGEGDDGADGTSSGSSSGTGTGTSTGMAAEGFPEGFDEVIGSVESVAVGDLYPVGFHEIYVGRDEGGLYAMTSRCNHEDCDMIGDGFIGSDFIECGCHGSRFSYDGELLNGPATLPLVHFAMAANSAGEVAVDTSTVVPPDERLPYPG